MAQEYKIITQNTTVNGGITETINEIVNTNSSIVDFSGLTSSISNFTNIPQSGVTNLITDLSNKQNQLNGTGFIKINGTTITYDNSNYITSYTESDPIVRAINGIVKSNGSTISAAVVRTDYAEPTTSLATGILKNTTTTGAHSIAISGTDYAPPTSGSGVLKGNGSGGFSNASGSDLNTTYGSQTNSSFLASPTASAGNPSFRQLVVGDLPGSIPLTNLAQQASNTFVANATGGSAIPTAISVTTATSLLNTFTTSLKGLTPASGGGTVNFLRADGTWAIPSGGSPSGLNTQIQFNNSGSFGADDDFTWDTTTNTLNISNVTSGGTINNIGNYKGGTSTLNYNPSNAPLTVANNVNNFNQIIIQNRNNGNSASSNFVVNTDNSTDTTNFGSFGRNSSTFSGTNPLDLPNTTYIESNGGDLTFGTRTSNIINFVTNNKTTADLSIGVNGQILIGGSAGTSGQVLTSQGGASAPIWQTPSGGGGGLTLQENLRIKYILNNL